jgi:moderate conductance mechanosensitive channel
MHLPVTETAGATLPMLAPDTPAEERACGTAGDLCLLVFRATRDAWPDHAESVAQVAETVLGPPLRILVVVIVALLVNRFLQRGIDRFLAGLETSARRGLTRSKGDGAAPLLVTAPLSPRAKQRAETVGVVLRSLAKAVVGVVAGLMVLGELGVNLGPLIAGAGIVGVALGFGSQALVRDFLSGIFMIIEDQFGVGDIIDVGEANGTVEGISLRTTRIRDVEGTVWHVPNGEIHRVANFSQEWSRALLDIEVAYETDIGRAEAVIKRVADDLWRAERFPGSILEEPDLWGVQTLGAHGVVIRLVIKTRPADQWKVLRALRRDIKDAFDAEGIEIPFPQQAVWVRGADRDGDPAVFPPGPGESPGAGESSATGEHRLG